MLPDRRCGFSLTHKPSPLRFVCIVIGVHVDDPHPLLAPFLTQAPRHLGLGLSAAAMVGDEANGLEAGGFQAASNAFQRAGEHVFRNADGARKSHVSGRRIVLAFRNIGDHRGDESAAKLSAIWRAVAARCGRACR